MYYYYLNRFTFSVRENVSAWCCPFCQIKTAFQFLVVDEFFLQILDSKDLPPDATEVIFVSLTFLNSLP